MKLHEITTQDAHHSPDIVSAMMSYGLYHAQSETHITSFDLKVILFFMS